MSLSHTVVEPFVPPLLLHPCAHSITVSLHVFAEITWPGRIARILQHHEVSDEKVKVLHANFAS